MSSHDVPPAVFPPELAELEQMLRATPPAPPPALLQRIVETREGVVVMYSSPDPFIPEQRAWYRRWTTAAAAAAVLVVGAVGAWISTRSANETTERAIATGTPERVSDPREISRLLQPWPAVAHAQRPSRGAIARGPSTALEPTTLSRLTPSTRVYSQIRQDAKGRTVGRARVEVRLDSGAYRGALRWLLTTKIEESVGGVQTDSIVLAPTTLKPLQRRVHAGGTSRFFRYTPRQVLATDTLPRLFFEEEFDTRASLWDSKRTSGRGFWYSVRPVDAHAALVLSESHLALLLRTVPLTVGLEMPVVFFDNSTSTFDGPQPLQLRVTKLDTLLFQNAQTPCVRVEVDYGRRPDVWWVRMSDGELLRSSRSVSPSATSELTTLEVTPRGRP